MELVSSLEIDDDSVIDDFYVSKFKCDEIEKNTPYNNVLCIPSVLTTDDSYTYFPVFSVIGRELNIVSNPDDYSYIGFVHYASNNETSTEYSHLNSLSISEKNVVDPDSHICIRLCSH